MEFGYRFKTYFLEGRSDLLIIDKEKEKVLFKYRFTEKELYEKPNEKYLGEFCSLLKDSLDSFNRGDYSFSKSLEHMRILFNEYIKNKNKYSNVAVAILNYFEEKGAELIRKSLKT